MRPEVVEVPRIEEADYGVLYGAEKVAERHADSLAYRATASVGVIRDLTDEETLRLVADARHARRVAWGYSVIASARRHGDDPGPRALEYVTGWREALA